MKTWILDIDGVLNPVDIKPPTNIWKTWLEYDVTDLQTGKNYPVKIATDVIDFVKEIDFREDVNILWHTTWQFGANDVAEIFGLPQLPILAAPEFGTWNHRTSQGWWKMPAVERLLAVNDHDVLWTDDDLSVVHPVPQHRPGFRLEMIAPDQREGLTRKHLKQIREFLDKENT